jgi:hypothetical protein
MQRAGQRRGGDKGCICQQDRKGIRTGRGGLGFHLPNRVSQWGLLLLDRADAAQDRDLEHRLVR